MSEPQQPPPPDEQLRVAMIQTLEQIFLHSKANTDFVMAVNAKLAGVEAHTHATVESLDEASNQAAVDRGLAAQKELITHFMEKSHQYVVVVMAGFFTASFATFSTVAPRLTDSELRLSALLLTVSLAVFVFWEVVNVCYIGAHTMKGDIGVIQKIPRALQIGWPAAMFLSLATGLPAIFLAAYAYLRGLHIIDWGRINF
jgi:hypothetical protein